MAPQALRPVAVYRSFLLEGLLPHEELDGVLVPVLALPRHLHDRLPCTSDPHSVAYI